MPSQSGKTPKLAGRETLANWLIRAILLKQINLLIFHWGLGCLVPEHIMAIVNKMLLVLLLIALPGQFATAQTPQDALTALQKQDYPEALRILRPLAERGDAKAQNNLGKMFEQGLGVARDDTEAMNWYRKSAEQGLAEAQYNLGLMSREGQGTPKN